MDSRVGEQLVQADEILNACGRPVAPRGSSFVDLPRMIPVKATLAVLPDGSLQTPFTVKVENQANTLFLVCGLASEGIAPYRVRWPNGRFLSQRVGGDARLSDLCFPTGTGGAMLALNNEQPVERGGRIVVEIGGGEGGSGSVVPLLQTITTPAVSIPGVVPPDYDFAPPSLDGNNNYAGPFVSGTSVYQLLLNTAGVISVYRSTDNGLTWAAQDVLNQPTANNGFSVTQAGSTLNVALLQAGDIVVQLFDCLTNTWGAASPAAGLATVVGASIVVQSTGNRFVYFTHSGAGNVMGFAQLSAVNVWSAPVTIVTAPGGRHVSLMGALDDGTGTMQVEWLERNSAGGLAAVVRNVPVSAAGVVGVTTIVQTLTPTLQGRPSNPVFSPSLASGGTFAMPLPIQFDNTPTTGPEVILGNPSTGWFVSSPDPTGSTVPAGSVPGTLSCAVFSTGGILATWNVFDTTTGLVDSIWASVWNGSAWTAPVMLYDAVGNPPAGVDPPSSLQQADPITVGPILNGEFGLVFALNVTPGIFATRQSAFFAPFGGTPPASEETIFLQFWGVLRYIVTGGDDAGAAGAPGGARSASCIVGYPAEAQAQRGGRGPVDLATMPDPIEELRGRRRYWCGPNHNTMAPEFRLGNQCFFETPEGCEDEPFTFFSDVYTVKVREGQSYNNAVLIPGANDVVIRRWRAFITWPEGATGAPCVGMRLPNGYSITGGDLIPVGATTAGAPPLFAWVPMFPTVLVRAGDRLILDVAVFDGFSASDQSLSVYFEFDAVKRRRK